MWDKLDYADLDRARQELRLRHAETVRRHAEELSALDAERAEVDALNQPIGAFAEKFKTSPAEPTREPFERFRNFAVT